MPYAQCTPLLDSIALEAQMLSGFSEKEVPRAHAQGFLWSQLDSSDKEEIVNEHNNSLHLSPNQNSNPNQNKHLNLNKNNDRGEFSIQVRLAGLDNLAGLRQSLPSFKISSLTPYDVGKALIEKPECYTFEQKHAFISHVEKHWGKSHVVVPSHAITFYDTFMQGEISPQIQFEVRCIPVHLNQRYYDLYFTVGLGAYLMSVPVDASEGRPVELERVEFMLRLPPFYGEDNFRDFAKHSPQGGWPLLLLRSLALKVLHSHQFSYQEYKRHTLPVPYVTCYQSYKSAPSLAPWPDLSGCMLLEPQDFDVLANLCKLPHKSHNLIRIIGVLPLYAEEMAFKNSIDIQGKSGGRALIRKLTELGFDPWLASLERPHFLLT